MKFEFNNVYVTGASGWLGKQLIEVLLSPDCNKAVKFSVSNNLKVNAMVLPGENFGNLYKESETVKVFNGDIRIEQNVKDFFNSMDNSLLVHTAGIIHPSKVKDFYDINLDGTKKIINEAIEKGVNKIVVISSNSPIGCNNSTDEPFDENSEYSPYMNYGKSKMLMELYLNDLISKGHNISIIRPPWFHGGNMPDRQKSFYSMIIKGYFPIFGRGNTIRSVANVNNIVQGIILCATKEISSGKTYWIADEKNLTMKQIIRTIEKVISEEFNVECKKNKIYVPSFFGDLFEALDYLIQKTGFYNQKIHVLSEMNKNIFCDITKAKKELGYAPNIDLYQGTKDALLEYFNE